MPLALRTQWGLIVGAKDLESILGNSMKNFLSILTLEFKPRKAPVVLTELYIIGYWHDNRFTPERPRSAATRVYSLPVCTTALVTSLGFSFTDMISMPPNRPPLKLYTKLYDNQAILVSAIVEQISRDKSCYCNMRAGAGKTRMAGAIFARLHAKSLLYIVPRVDLAKQTFDDLVDMLLPRTYIAVLNEYTKLKKLMARKLTIDLISSILQSVRTIRDNMSAEFMRLPRIGIGMSRNVDSSAPLITIMTIHSAMLLQTPDIAKYDMIVFDEAHEYVSGARHAFIARSNVQWRLAMSATTADRSDGLDPVIYAHFCPGYRRGGSTGIIAAEDVPGFTYDEVEFKSRAKVIHYYGPDSHVINLKNTITGELSPLLMRKMFMRDESRLQLILGELLRLYNWSDGDKQHHIYVYCEEIDSVQIIYHYIRNNSDIDSDAPELFTFTGGCRNGTEVRNCARVIVTTYGYSGTGTSIPKMTAMIWATSRRAKLKQVIGRCLRRNGDISITREYVYICDDRTFLRAQLPAILTAFQSYKIPIKHTRVRHDAISTPDDSSHYDLLTDDPDDNDNNDDDDLDDDGNNNHNDNRNDNRNDNLTGPSVIDDE